MPIKGIAEMQAEGHSPEIVLLKIQARGERLPLFNAIENSGAAWQMPVDRDAWRQ